VFARYSVYPYSAAQGTIFAGGDNALQSGNIYAFSASVTYAVTLHVVVDSVFGLTHYKQELQPPNSNVRYGSDVLGIPGTNLGDLPFGGSIPQFNVSNYALYGYGYPALKYIDPVFQYTGNAS
jgi:hypothetical protein